MSIGFSLFVIQSWRLSPLTLGTCRPPSQVVTVRLYTLWRLCWADQWGLTRRIQPKSTLLPKKTWVVALCWWYVLTYNLYVLDLSGKTSAWDSDVPAEPIFIYYFFFLHVSFVGSHSFTNSFNGNMPEHSTHKEFCFFSYYLFSDFCSQFIVLFVS